MPVFGLRFAEHPMYTRRYGGTPLYADTYGVAVSTSTDKFEAHATGFIEDPLIDPVEHASGGALYGELRVTDTLSVGAERHVEISDDDKKIRGGVIAKLYAARPGPAAPGRAAVRESAVDRRRTGAPVQLIAEPARSRAGSASAFLLDVGLGHFDSNIRIRDLDRDCVDVNLHWFIDVAPRARSSTRVTRRSRSARAGPRTRTRCSSCTTGCETDRACTFGCARADRGRGAVLRGPGRRGAARSRPAGGR